MTDFADALSRIKEIPQPKCRDVEAILLSVWRDRLNEEDFDWKTSFIGLLADAWGLSTCSDQQKMAAFAEDEASGYPAFATDQAVLEFNDSWWSEDDPFAILLWKELAETGRAYA